MFEHDLILARHGQTEWNAIGRMQGRLNSGLTARGRQEAARLAQILSGLDLSRYDVRISPQGRVVQTAGIALGHREVPLRSDDRLMEIDIGEWSGLEREELRALRSDLFTDDPAARFAWYDAAPGGEGYEGLRARAEALLSELRGPTLFLTHGITLRMLRSLALCGTAARFGEGRAVRQGVAYLCRAGEVIEIETPEQMAAHFPA